MVCASFSRFRRDSGAVPGRRASLSLEPFLSSRLVEAGNPLLHSVNVVEVPNILGLDCPLVRFIVQAEVGAIHSAQVAFRSVAVAVLRQGFAPWIGRPHNVEFVVVPSGWEPVHNRHPIGNVMGPLGEPERGDWVMSVHGGVVGSGETKLEERRRLFGRRTRSLHFQPHPRIADNDLIEMRHFRTTLSLSQSLQLP